MNKKKRILYLASSKIIERINRQIIVNISISDYLFVQHCGKRKKAII
jgi:hypothetical protein